MCTQLVFRENQVDYIPMLDAFDVEVCERAEGHASYHAHVIIALLISLTLTSLCPSHPLRHLVRQRSRIQALKAKRICRMAIDSYGIEPCWILETGDKLPAQQKSENMPQLNVRLLPVAHPAHIEILELK